MALNKTLRQRSYAGIVCPCCAKTLPRSLLATGELECPFCKGQFTAAAFTPPVRKVRVRQVTDSPDAPTACAIHERNTAVANCGRCGNFMCNLCKIDADDMALCPACFERLSGEGTLNSAQTTIRNWAGIASSAAVCGFLIWPLSFIFGPAAIWCGVKALKMKREMGERDGVIGIYAAIVIGFFQFVGIFILFVALVLGIAGGLSGHHR